MKETLEFIVTALVDNPDSVRVDEEEVDGVIQFTVDVAPEDMGKIIGKNGKVIRSIRNVMKIVAMKHNKRINVSLKEQPQTTE